MDDLISRQAAIDELNAKYHGMISDESMKIYQIINWLDNLPSAEPKRGKWVSPFGIGCVCDCCGYDADGESNFCPNCGAKMEETNGN